MQVADYAYTTLTNTEGLALQCSSYFMNKTNDSTCCLYALCPNTYLYVKA